ncbi:hypothetical protein ACFU7T_32025 [Streptomyces sp. NPDC057555]|uniref:hypothetical protein n=1 Tax=Streptomyces sp. NPDC057555 TaxID=3346166 RepID=UPI003673F253
METTPTTSEPADVPTGDGQAPTEAANAPEEPARPEEQGDGQELDADALRAELKAVRAEAARSPEEYQAVADRAAELETDLHRERLAHRYGLPDALAARISGADDDAREADAKTLAELFHGRADGMGRGGLDPSAKPVSNDPAELAAGIPRGRR